MNRIDNVPDDIERELWRMCRLKSLLADNPDPVVVETIRWLREVILERCLCRLVAERRARLKKEPATATILDFVKPVRN